MTEENTQYATMSVTAIRGTEKKTIERWEAEGWEFVSQDRKNPLQATLQFRRVKKPFVFNRRIAAIVGATVVVLAGIIVAGVISEKGDEPTPAVASSATSSQPQSPTSTSAAPDSVAASTPATTASPADPAPAASKAVITVSNNPAFAALLQEPDNCSESVGNFAQQNAGKTIQFDGNIANATNHGDYSTRFDFLLTGGDYSTESQRGPTFQYRDVNLQNLGFPTAATPESVTTGQNYTFEAEVLAYQAAQCLLQLKPITTTVR